MKKVLILGGLCLFALKTMAQAPNYDDLKILYADANYDKLVKAAEKYTLKDATMGDPIPFVYLSKGLYKISLSGTDEEKYKNAYEEAITALSNALKKDKTGTKLTDPIHLEYIATFQGSLAERLSAEYQSKNFIKVSTWAMKYQKVTRNPVCAKYIIAACKFEKKDKAGAMKDWKEADKLFESVKRENLTESDLLVLKLGVIKTAEGYIALKQSDKGKALMDKVAEWFKDDEEFTTKYKELYS